MRQQGILGRHPVSIRPGTQSQRRTVLAHRPSSSRSWGSRTCAPGSVDPTLRLTSLPQTERRAAVTPASCRSRIARASDRQIGLWAASCPVAYRSSESDSRPPAARDEPLSPLPSSKGQETSSLTTKRGQRAQGNSKTLRLRQHARLQHNLPEEERTVTSIIKQMRYHYQTPGCQQLNLPGGTGRTAHRLAGRERGASSPVTEDHLRSFPFE